MPEGVAVRAFVRTPEALVVQDANGALWSVPLEDGTDGEPQVLMQGHSGAITGLDTSPVDHFAFTCGADATVRCWDYVDQKQIAMTSFNASATSLVWANTQVDPNGRTVAVGFANGVVRVLMRGSEDIPLLHVFKPHTGKVLCVSYSGDGSYLATGGEDGLLFLLRIADSEESPDGKEYTPVGFVDLAAPVTSIDWNSRNDAVLVSLGANGGAAEVRMPNGTPNTATSYELRLDTRKFTFQPPTPKPTAEELAAKAAAEEEARRRAEEGEDPERPSTADLVNPFEQAKIDPGASLAAVYSPIADTPNASFLVRALWLCGSGSGSGCGDGSALTLVVFGVLLVQLSVAGTGFNALHECTWDHPKAQRSFPSSGGRPTCVIRRSHSGKFLLTGSQDGSVWLRPNTLLRNYIRVGAHDGDNGAVRGVATSYVASCIALPPGAWCSGAVCDLFSVCACAHGADSTISSCCQGVKTACSSCTASSRSRSSRPPRHKTRPPTRTAPSSARSYPPLLAPRCQTLRRSSRWSPPTTSLATSPRRT